MNRRGDLGSLQLIQTQAFAKERTNAVPHRLRADGRDDLAQSAYRDFQITRKTFTGPQGL